MTVIWPVVDVLPEIWTPVVDDGVEVDDEVLEDPDVEFETVDDDDPVVLPVVPDEETTHCVPLKAYPGKHEKQ